MHQNKNSFSGFKNSVQNNLAVKNDAPIFATRN